MNALDNGEGEKGNSGVIVNEQIAGEASQEFWKAQPENGKLFVDSEPIRSNLLVCIHQSNTVLTPFQIFDFVVIGSALRTVCPANQ